MVGGESPHPSPMIVEDSGKKLPENRFFFFVPSNDLEYSGKFLGKLFFPLEWFGAIPGGTKKAASTPTAIYSMYVVVVLVGRVVSGLLCSILSVDISSAASLDAMIHMQMRGPLLARLSNQERGGGGWGIWVVCTYLYALKPRETS